MGKLVWAMKLKINRRSDLFIAKSQIRITQLKSSIINLKHSAFVTTYPVSAQVRCQWLLLHYKNP